MKLYTGIKPPGVTLTTFQRLFSILLLTEPKYAEAMEKASDADARGTCLRPSSSPPLP